MKPTVCLFGHDEGHDSSHVTRGIEPLQVDHQTFVHLKVARTKEDRANNTWFGTYSPIFPGPGRAIPSAPIPFGMRQGL